MKFTDLKPGGHIHLMGICGTAMASLAGILQQLGYKITGSDQNIYPPMSTQLAALKIQIREGYKKENLTPRPDYVIVGNVMTRKHEEVQALLESDIPYTSLPAAMGEVVIGKRRSVVIAGTHGKTTTTAMMAWVSEVAGEKPGFLIGGIPKNFSNSFAAPQNDLFVIEGDEYDTAFFDKVPKFIHYKPKYVILTSIEFDHADIYKNLDEVKAAFIRLLQLIPEDGVLVYQAKDKNIQTILSHTRCKNLISYSFDQGDVQAQNLKLSPEFCQFDILSNMDFTKNSKKNSKSMQIQLPAFGKYNIENALAVYALATKMNMNPELVVKGLNTFAGVKRRQEVIGHPRGITVIEDFAHHPTAVKLTIEAVSERFRDQKNTKIFAVFEPRSATSRRRIFQKQYAEAFGASHDVIIAKPFNQTSIEEADRFSAEELVCDIQKHNVNAQCIVGTDDMVGYLKTNAKPGDVILIMSNGGFDGIYNKLLSALT